MRLAIGLATGALVIGAIGAGVGVIGLASADDANQKADAAEAKADAILVSRDASRKIVCDAFNEQQLRARAGDDRQTRTQFESLAAFAGDDRTPEEEAEVRAYLEGLYADQAKASEESYPLRDCSPEGIALFYEGKS